MSVVNGEKFKEEMWVSSVNIGKQAWFGSDDLDRCH
jgi:hypothetical protein